MYKHKSGAQKRKQKKEEHEKLQKYGKIETFFAENKTTTHENTETDNSTEEIHDAIGRVYENGEDVEFVNEPSHKRQEITGPVRFSSYFRSKSILKDEGIVDSDFWRFHPQQPTTNIPFNSKTVYHRRGMFLKLSLYRYIYQNI